MSHGRCMASSASVTPQQLASAASARLQQAITEDVCADLKRQGYAVVDNLFQPEHAALLREEIVQLFKVGALSIWHTVINM